MAIKFGMKLPEIFAQLVRGYKKVTGRNPEGLDLIKIRQESLRRFQDMNKVVDMQTGKSIDASKPIVGGSQEFASGIMKAMKTKPREVKTEDMIKKKLEKQNKESIKKIKERKFEDAVKAERDKMAADEDYIPDIIDPDDFAIGGRVGLKKGSMDRRTFMKIMGGLATLPILGRYFKGAEKAAPVIEKATETVTQAPSYFFDLVAKIKMFGKQSKVGPAERVDEYSYIGKNGDEYTLTEDIVTGDAQIVKDKMGIGTSGDKSFDTINDRTVLEYKAPKKDVDPDTQKFIDEGAEYEEYKIEFDQDGTQAGADAIDEIIQKEIIEESKKAAPPIKKAAGGLAYMLGE